MIHKIENRVNFGKSFALISIQIKLRLDTYYVTTMYFNNSHQILVKTRNTVLIRVGVHKLS